MLKFDKEAGLHKIQILQKENRKFKYKNFQNAKKY